MHYQNFLKNTPVRRACVLASVIVVLWLARSIMSTILLTFIFAFLVTRVLNLVRRHIPIRAVAVVVPLYLLVVAGVMYAAIHYVPEIIKQTVSLFNSVLEFYNNGSFDNNETIQWILKSIDQMNLKTQIQHWLAALLQYAGSIGAMGVTFVLSLLLSFFFTVEIDSLKKFGNLFIHSPFGWYFADLKFFADKFIDTFGVVIEAQIVIAMVNTAITTITLIFLKMPNIPSLAIMVFILSLIPVAGAFISTLPLAIIAFTVDGIKGVITIIIMILVIHTLEAYVLNPKFMSSRTKLPIFFTFVVLLVGEQLFGVWGLIVGIPIFTFLLDIIGVKKIADN
ncbi:AI-2E family transporter [Lacticaseibacillus baoqingensis]|uniref:AI-2E family transporter n=1 Tax=Lacticaseibacillus baoqingensis TaxID=2486013 RepID=A0ABW4E3Z7_9LACO